MCIRIVRHKEESSYDPTIPLEQQVRGAKHVVVDYDPNDSHMKGFMDEIERIVKNGISCQMNIKVNAKNTLDGFRFERRINKITKDLDINEVIKSLVMIHAQTDDKLKEISEMCLMEKVNERQTT